MSIIHTRNIFGEWTLDFIFSGPYYEPIPGFEDLQDEVEHLSAPASPEPEEDEEPSYNPLKRKFGC